MFTKHFAAGHAVVVPVRFIVHGVSNVFGQQLMVENRAGAGTIPTRREGGPGLRFPTELVRHGSSKLLLAKRLNQPCLTAADCSFQ